MARIGGAVVGEAETGAGLGEDGGSDAGGDGVADVGQREGRAGGGRTPVRGPGDREDTTEEGRGQSRLRRRAVQGA